MPSVGLSEARVSADHLWAIRTTFHAIRRLDSCRLLLSGVASILTVAGFASLLSAEEASKWLYGAFGPEGPRMREQLWLLPSGDENVRLRATLFRPPRTELGPHLAIINHGSPGSGEARRGLSLPVFFQLSRWFVDRGNVVLLPQRRGHGATGGPHAETIGPCESPDYVGAGQKAADDIEAVIAFMTSKHREAFQSIVVVGQSTGGWGSLALAARNPDGVRAVINFAGGRGGHAKGKANANCAPDRLVAAASAFGRTAKIPTLWIYSKNDTYFGPELATSMADAWRRAGGQAELHLVPPFGNDGHDLARDPKGSAIWGPIVEQFLKRIGMPNRVGE